MSRYGEKIPRLGDEELRAIRESLLSDASRREAYAPEGPLTVVIDGEPCDSLDPNRERRVRRAVGDETGWIEVRDGKSGSGLLLAAHLYRHDEVPPKGRKKYETTLEGGQRITFVAYSKGGRPYVEISYGETSLFKSLALYGRLLKNELNRLARSFLGTTRLAFTPRGALTARRAAYSLALLCLCGTVAILILKLPSGGTPDAPPHIASNGPVHSGVNIQAVPMPDAPADQPPPPAPAPAAPTPLTANARSTSSAKTPNPKQTPRLASQPKMLSTPSSPSPQSENIKQARIARTNSYLLRRLSGFGYDPEEKSEAGLADRSKLINKSEPIYQPYKCIRKHTGS